MIHTWVTWVCSPLFVWSWIALAVVALVVLTRISAPYGRHGRGGWGPPVPARWAWFGMEIVTLVGFGLCFWASESTPWPCTLFFGLYAGHYGYRACIYPWLNPPGAAPVPFSIAGMAALFNLLNSTILGGWLFLLGPPLEIPTPRLVVGVFLFVMGFFIHVRSDAILRSLRRDLGPGYHIPSGFMYRWVSCPNYLGEIMQWFGFALAVHALPVWSFVAWTIANLLPRAMRHHQWYRERFDDYPAGRKAILPGLL